jgi:hypothetical protein
MPPAVVVSRVPLEDVVMTRCVRGHGGTGVYGDKCFLYIYLCVCVMAAPKEKYNNSKTRHD